MVLESEESELPILGLEFGTWGTTQVFFGTAAEDSARSYKNILN